MNVHTWLTFQVSFIPHKGVDKVKHSDIFHCKLGYSGHSNLGSQICVDIFLENQSIQIWI